MVGKYRRLAGWAIDSRCIGGATDVNEAIVVHHMLRRTRQRGSGNAFKSTAQTLGGSLEHPRPKMLAERVKGRYHILDLPA
nr:hypothetical protein [Tanacetum cinerariifolium]